MERVIAHYLVETPLDVRRAAEVLAGEQSSGTFVAVPGETAELKQRFAARVESVTPLETVAQPSLPGARGGSGTYHRARIAVSWSTENFGFNLPALVSTLQGNLYELAQFSGLRLLDFEVPASFAAKFRGPQFGIAGSRALTGVSGRPLIGTIIKPSIGLTPAQTADLVRTLVEAGIDFIKDDELMADPPHSPFDARVEAVMAVINAHADRTGKKVMYAFNVSDESDAMQRHYDKIVAAGGTCAMVSVNSVGLAATKKISDRGALAVHGHRNGWGMLNRHPALGLEFPAYQKLWRLAGVDQLHVNGLANKFWEPDDSVVRSIESCLAPWHTLTPVLPVVSSGQWGGQAPETWRRTQTTDLLYMAGGGILAHPDGARAGARSLQRWWEAATQGLDANKAVEKFPELAVSASKFGPKARGTGLRLAYYADDFTGATDALEALTRAGLKTVLFTSPPTREDLQRFPGLQAVGAAGMTRSRAPEAMEPELRGAFRMLRELGAPHVHYKVCSTFDSSPSVGSIGRAIDIGAEIFRARFVPLLVGAPGLGRYSLFGNLFARMGIGSAGEIHRLDRHPSMSRHPVTPADESDLRRHLAKQTTKRVGLLDVLQVARPTSEMRKALDALVEGGAEVVLIDVLEAEQLARIGALLDGAAGEEALFSVGSSGIEAALGAHWQAQGTSAAVSAWPDPGPATPLLVISGSCSPVTAQQIAWATSHGFASVPVAAAALASCSPSAFAAAETDVIRQLRAGRSVVLHTSQGETDPAVRALSAAARGTVGAALGSIARQAIGATGTRRLLVAGGDTASYATVTLGITALEMITPLAPGAPLCRAHAPGSPVDGIEVNFKGGQVGAADYFAAVAKGRI
jgi:ribulose-bisphosphate carboxylase large chain